MSPNVQKILRFLKEAGLDYRLTVIVNDRRKSIVCGDSGKGVRVFLSLGHVSDPVVRLRTFQWLFWQIGGLGAICGQLVHFRNYAPVELDYPMKRFGAEHCRLLVVLDNALQDQTFIAGDYSIADTACLPWLLRARSSRTARHRRAAVHRALVRRPSRAAGVPARSRDPR